MPTSSPVPHCHPATTIEMQVLESCPWDPKLRAAVFQVIADHFRDKATEVRLGIGGAFVKLIVPYDATPQTLVSQRDGCVLALAEIDGL